MTYPNPDYDSNWEARHDAHAIERDRAEQETTYLIKAGQMASDACGQAQARWRDHDIACKTALTSQHKTVQDYATWRFRSLPPDSEFQDVGVLLPVVDFESLTTIQAADAAWDRAHRIAKDTANDRQFSLPIGQPEGLAAFADAASPGLCRFERTFMPRELYPQGYAGMLGVRTLMTADELPGGRHVCFRHMWGNGQGSVTNAIERLASAVYREASAFAAQQPSGRVGPGLWIGRLLGRKPVLLDPAGFHFYDHTPPAPGGTLREDFLAGGAALRGR